MKCSISYWHTVHGWSRFLSTDNFPLTAANNTDEIRKWMWCAYKICSVVPGILCIWLCRFVYNYVTNMYINNTSCRLFTALLVENLLICVTCCLLFKFIHLQAVACMLCSASCREMHAFSKKTYRGHLAPKFFYLSFNYTPHTPSIYRLDKLAACSSFFLFEQNE